MKFVMHLKIKVSLIKWCSGKIMKSRLFERIFDIGFYSDDEGSDEEEQEEGEGDENDEDYEDEEDNDEDYEDEEEYEEDAESPSFFFGKTTAQQPSTWNSFQFGTPKTNTAQSQPVQDLSSMIANFNVCSPFSFGLQSTIEVIIRLIIIKESVYFL